MRYTMDNKYLGVTYDRTKAMDIPEDQFKLCKEANGQFCPLITPLQPLMNPPLCVAALYTKNSREIDRLCELTTKTPELYLPIPLASNVWAIISSPFKQQPPVTIICPTKPTMSVHISPPIHVLRLEPAWSATSQHFHLPLEYMRNPRDDEPIYLQCKPRHHKHLMRLIQDHSTYTVSATTRDA